MQDATSLSAAIASGVVTAPEVMEAALVAAGERAAGAMAVIDADLGRAGARGALSGRFAGRFAGVPFLGKDLGSGLGRLPTCGGSAALRRRASTGKADSVLFARFRAAGLVPFGLTTVPEFGLALTSDPAVNPFDPAYSPGGSSGGAAAAVAAGIVAMAHATDAAGSIRVPAACCGLLGLKPSRGAVPQGPDFGNHLMGVAAELVLARSVRDVRGIFDAVADVGPDAGPDAGPRDMASLRVAFCLPKRCGAAQAGAVWLVAEALRDLGCDMVERPAPDALGTRAAATVRTILTASLAEWMGALGVRDDEMTPLAAAVAAEGRGMAAATLFAASRDMAVIADGLATYMAGADVLLSPVLSGPPPKRGAFDMAATHPAAHFAQIEALAPNAALANVAGVPALSLPVGLDAAGLPLGVQITARIGQDRLLLDIGARLMPLLPRIVFPFPIAGHP